MPEYLHLVTYTFEADLSLDLLNWLCTNATGFAVPSSEASGLASWALCHNDRVCELPDFGQFVHTQDSIDLCTRSAVLACNLLISTACMEAPEVTLAFTWDSRTPSPPPGHELVAMTVRRVAQPDTAIVQAQLWSVNVRAYVEAL